MRKKGIRISGSGSLTANQRHSPHPSLFQAVPKTFPSSLITKFQNNIRHIKPISNSHCPTLPHHLSIKNTPLAKFSSKHPSSPLGLRNGRGAWKHGSQIHIYAYTCVTSLLQWASDTRTGAFMTADKAQFGTYVYSPRANCSLALSHLRRLYTSYIYKVLCFFVSACQSRVIEAIILGSLVDLVLMAVCLGVKVLSTRLLEFFKNNLGWGSDLTHLKVHDGAYSAALLLIRYQIRTWVFSACAFCMSSTILS